MAPKDENELQHMLRTAIEYPGPAAVRYPRGNGFGVPLDPEIKAIPIGRAELLRDGDDVALVALGTLVHPALEAADRLAGARHPRGRAERALRRSRSTPRRSPRWRGAAARWSRVEEHGGAAASARPCSRRSPRRACELPTRCLAVPDRVVEHGDPGAQRAAFGLDAAGIERAVQELLGGPAV